MKTISYSIWPGNLTWLYLVHQGVHLLFSGLGHNCYPPLCLLRPLPVFSMQVFQTSSPIGNWKMEGDSKQHMYIVLLAMLPGQPASSLWVQQTNFEHKAKLPNYITSYISLSICKENFHSTTMLEFVRKLHADQEILYAEFIVTKLLKLLMLPNQWTWHIKAA